MFFWIFFWAKSDERVLCIVFCLVSEKYMAIIKGGIIKKGDRRIEMAHMKRVIVFVADVEKCSEFYIQVFDLQPIAESYLEGEWRELETGGSALAFHKAYDPDGPVDTPTGSEANPHKLVFCVEDVAKAKTDFEAKGIEMGGVIVFGDISMCDGKDPEGHPFQVCDR